MGVSDAFLNQKQKGPLLSMDIMGQSRMEPVPRDCLICYDELNSDNTLEYQTSADSEWLPSLFCEECTEMLQNSQFDKYCHDLASTTCAREQRALLEKGPPVNLHDKNGFPMSGDAEIFKLRKANDKQEISAQLKGALLGEERMQFWENQKKFIIKNENVDSPADQEMDR